jgi:hypothetical protein
MIDELIEELQKCKYAKELLEQVWLAIGPYDNRGVFEDDPTLHSKLNDFMGFDDSE